MATDDYFLDQQERDAWRRHFAPRLPRGRKTKISKQLAETGLKKSSATTVVTGFFQGEESRLRQIFDDAVRTQIVADGVDMEPRALRGALDRVRGRLGGDGPHQFRVPGFEDLGPVALADGYFPPRYLGGGANFLDLQEANDERGVLDLDALLDALVQVEGPATILFEGTPGSGRSLLLRWLQTQLQDLDHQVVWWRPGTVPPTDGFLLVDDLDERPTALLEQLGEQVQAKDAVLLATARRHRARDVHIERRANLRLDTATGDWPGAYLEHLQALLARHDVAMDVASLRSELAHRAVLAHLHVPGVLGLLARHVAEGHSPAWSASRLVSVFVEQGAMRMRELGHGAEAALWDACGIEALEHLARGCAVEDRVDFAMKEFSRALAEAARANTLPDRETWQELGVAGTAGAIEALVEAGIVHRSAGRLRIERQVLVAAAGRAWASGAADDALFDAMVYEPGWTPALDAAAAVLRDTAPMLRTLLEGPPARLAVGFDALTRLVASSVPCSEDGLLDRAYRMCLIWWAHRAKKQSPHPVLALAEASRQHRGVLSPVSEIDLLAEAVELPGEIRVRLGLEDTRPSAEALRQFLAFATPYQSDAVLDSLQWSQAHGSIGWPGGMTRPDYHHWWRAVAVPRLREEPDGDARIAGVAEGHSLEPALQQPPSGVAHWREALARCLETGSEKAVDGFVAGCVAMLSNGSFADVEALQQVYKGIRSARTRGLISRRLARVLGDVQRVRRLHEYVGWLLQTVLRAVDRKRVWEIWSQDRRVEYWRLFRQYGLSDGALLDWALSAPSTDDAEEVLETLVEDAGPRILERLVREGDEPWPSRAFERVKRVVRGGDKDQPLRVLGRVKPVVWEPDAQVPGAWQELVLRLAVDQSSYRELLWSLRATPEQADLWQQVARAADRPEVQMLAWGQWALVTEEPEPWGPVLDRIDDVEVGAEGWYAPVHSALVRVLRQAMVQGAPEPWPVFRAMLARDLWSNTPQVEGMWATTSRHLDEKELLAWMRRLAEGAERLELMRMATELRQEGRLTLLERAISEPSLRGPVATAWCWADRPRRLSLLDMVWERGVGPSETDARHIVRFALITPEQTFEWLANRLEDDEPDNRRAWWEFVLDNVRGRYWRARALEHWGDARSGS